MNPDFLSFKLEPQQSEQERCPFHDLWLEATKIYVVDVQAHQKWLVWPSACRASDNGEAWRDLRGDRKILNRLCGFTGLDADTLADGMMAGLRAQCEGGMQ